MWKFLEQLKVRLLGRRAFRAADRGDYEEAIRLLTVLLEVEPHSAGANNEMGFCLTRLGRLEEARTFAKLAHHLAPTNPKYLNSLIAISYQAALKLPNRRGLAPEAAQLLSQCDALIRMSPNYPPVYLGKANVLALSGAPREEWEAVLDQCAEAYERTLRDPPGRSKVSDIIHRHVFGCLELAKHWAGLPEG